MREMLTSIGYEGSKFSLHSMKRGAATHCDQIGMPEGDIMEEGGWKNLKTARLYINKKDTKRIKNALKMAQNNNV